MNLTDLQKRKLKVSVIPALQAGIVFIIGIIVLEFASDFAQGGETTNALIVLGLGGILAIGSVLWWGIATDVAILRVELNELRKLP